MSRILAVLAVLALCQTACAAPQGPATPPPAAAPLSPDEAAMQAHVAFLASDGLKGRLAGTSDYDVAAKYVAARFAAAGLSPAGDKGSYLQRVPLLAYRAADRGDLILTRAHAAPAPLAFGVDYLPGANPAKRETAFDAQVVFVGEGIVAPQYGRDDYAGVDVKGRIVALIEQTPRGFTGEERAHFSNLAVRATIAGERGAVGVLVVAPNTFPRGGDGWDRSRTTWAETDSIGFQPGAPLLATLSASGAAKLFDGARTPWSQIVRHSGDPDARFTPVLLPGRLAGSMKTLFERTDSSNVAGLIAGSDPALTNEVVVLSAHLDHLGVGRPVKGDSIYNGAEDNAVGVASLIEEAKRFEASGRPPRRSVLFLAVTAEEEGLVGSDYFARHPGLPGKTLVADVNLDMPILTYPFEDLIAFGADHSSLGPIVRKAAAALGLAVSPDPNPEQGVFVRSDHYRFVQQGVPSVFLWPGQAGPGKAATEAFFRDHYHQPSDEVSLPIDWAQGYASSASITPSRVKSLMPISGRRGTRAISSGCSMAVSARADAAVRVRLGLYRNRASPGDCAGSAGMCQGRGVAARWRSRTWRASRRSYRRRAIFSLRCRPAKRLTRFSSGFAARWRDRVPGSAISPRPAFMAIPAGRGSTRAHRPAADGALCGSGGSGLARSRARVFRLPGIYGPGRSPLDRLREGRAHRVDAPGQVFSRVFLHDLVQGVMAAFHAPPGAYNLADDQPASQNEVLEFAARLARLPPPPSIAIEALPPAARAFYAENRRIANGKAKRVLGWAPAYPDYRAGLRALNAMTRPAAASAAPAPASKVQ